MEVKASVVVDLSLPSVDTQRTRNGTKSKVKLRSNDDADLKKRAPLSRRRR